MACGGGATDEAFVAQSSSASANASRAALAEPGGLDAVAALQRLVQRCEMPVERLQRRLTERQHQRLGGIAGDAGDALQGVHHIAFAARRQLEEGAVGRGKRPGIEEARGAAVVAAAERLVEARRIEAADDAESGAARAERRPERRPGVEKRAQLARLAAAVAAKGCQPGGGLVAPQQRARRLLVGRVEQLG